MTGADAQAIVNEKTDALLDRIVEDSGRHGGLLSRETTRAADAGRPGEEDERCWRFCRGEPHPDR
jgi:hypothetical protein